jgi:hypothetical protein
MVGVEYRYELRRGDQVVATGRLSVERPFGVGDRVEIGGKAGIVRDVEPVLGERALRLVAQLVRDGLAAKPADRLASPHLSPHPPQRTNRQGRRRPHCQDGQSLSFRSYPAGSGRGA